MNRLFCALLFIIMGIITEAQSRSIDYFEAKIYDLGEVMNSGGPIRCQFVLMNRTSQALRIQSVNASCGCLKAEWTKTMIKPEEKGFIDVIYANSDNVGPVSKKILVYLSNGEMQILEIRGLVIDEGTNDKYNTYCYNSLCLRSKVIDIGAVTSGMKMKQELSVYNSSEEWLSFRLHTGDNDAISIKMEDIRVSPKSEQKVTYDILVLSECYGEINTDAILIVNGEAVSKVKFRGSLQINSDTFSHFDYMVSPYMVFSTKIIRDESIRVDLEKSYVFKYKNVGLRPLRIYKIEYDASMMDVDYRDITKARSKGQIKVTLKHRSIVKSNQIYSVYVYTNSPKSPMIKLMVIGNRKKVEERNNPIILF